MDVKLDKDKIYIGVIISLLVIIIGGAGFLLSSKPDSNLSTTALQDEVEPKDETSTKDEYIYIHVSGHVINAGVYKLPAGSRIHQAIELAGGPTEEGDLDRLNLAQIIQDGQKITVPSTNSEPGEEYYQDESQGKININAASQGTLETLTGIGPAKAIAIINYREDNGPFSKIEDIQNVPGIGPATFNQIKNDITI